MTDFSLRVLTTIVAMTVCGKWAAAQVALKPTGQNALPLRAKSLAATVLVKQSRFVTTDLELTFANDLQSRVEADFVYTVPEGAVVTDFAYFFGTERVPARVAEKARAAAIYKAITTRQRDPALVEMVGKNTFRARIFPLEPNADLRVQIRYVQVLPVDLKGAATLSLPLQTPKSVKWDKVDVAVRVAKSGASVANNFGLPTGTDNAGNTLLSFSGTNYRTDKNLRVSLAAPKPGATPYLAATSGGADGFFAATITAPVGVKLDKATLQSSGAGVYAVSAKRLSPRDILVTGRYKKTGTARFSVLDATNKRRVSTASLVFTGAAEANSPATKLWAAAQIERLSRRDTSANRTAGIALSKRFTLLSRWTSWIAIPVEERKRYEREKAEAELGAVATALYKLRKRGRGMSGEANGLRSQFFALCKAAGRTDPQDTLGQYLSNAAHTDSYVAERRREQQRDDKARRISARLYQLIREKRGDSRAAAVLRKRFNTLFVAAGFGERQRRNFKNYLEADANVSIQAAAQQTVKVIAANGRDSAAARQARAILTARCLEVGKPVESLRYVFQGAVYQRQAQAVENVVAGNAGTDSDKRLRRGIERLTEEIGQGMVDTLQKTLKYRLRRTATDWAQHTHGEILYSHWHDDTPYRQKLQTKPGTVERLRLQVDRLANAVGANPQTFLEKAQEPWYWEEMRQKRNAVVDVYKRNPINESEGARREADFVAEARSERGEVVAEVAHKYFYGANTPDGRETFARDRLARIRARTEADKLDKQLKTPLSPGETQALQTYVAALRKTETDLRTRMGDPLLFVDAPRFAKSVTATLPNGEIVPLAWDNAAGRWQCRFDIPTYAAEGDYVVRVELVLASGSRMEKTFAYTVDTTAPTGTLTATRTDTGVRVEVMADTDTVRAVAVVAGGETMQLTADPAHPGRFFGVVAESGGTVTVVITDRAHNRTTLTATIRGGVTP